MTDYVSPFSVTQFGIALPKWIVDGKNSYLVLAAYVLVFMVIMPTLVVSRLISDKQILAIAETR